MSKAGLIISGVVGAGALAAVFSWIGDHGIRACQPDGDGGAKLHHADGRVTSVRQMTISGDGRYCVINPDIFIPTIR